MDIDKRQSGSSSWHGENLSPRNGLPFGPSNLQQLGYPNKREIRQVACGIIRAAIPDAVHALQRHVSDKFDQASHKLEKFITSAEFDRGLGKIIPPSRTPDGMPSRGTFRDAEIDEISNLLQLYGKFDWSFRPRTFAILRMVHCMDALESSVSDNFSDVSLPYTEENLPNMVKGARVRALFLKVQDLVLTPSAEIEKNPMGHQRFPRSADKYYIEQRELGAGGFGQVDLVVSRASLKSYARKRIPRGRSFKKDNEVIKSFENELKVLKLLSHKHLVKLAGSYTDPQWVTLLMTPVADMNLARYLTADIDLQDRQICLRRFFGCLANAVAYLHKMEVRHKDIKPQNILVKGRNVLLTDFGTSHSWSDSTRSGTSGTVPVFTRKYCAPEVADYAVSSSIYVDNIWLTL
jgi:Protein kinase domain